MKHVGLNVAADPRHDTRIYRRPRGHVIIVADDPGCHSSQNEQDSRRWATFAEILCLDPSTPQEAYDFVKYAFNLSESFELPVLLRPTTQVSHAKGSVITSGRSVNKKIGRILKKSQMLGNDSTICARQA